MLLQEAVGWQGWRTSNGRRLPSSGFVRSALRGVRLLTVPQPDVQSWFLTLVFSPRPVRKVEKGQRGDKAGLLR